MAAAAAVTEWIELGTCILQVRLRRPVELAHRNLSVHYLSGGRVRLGVGAGSMEVDFKAIGNDYGARFRTLAEALPVMRSLWCGETVGEANLTPLDPVGGGPPVLIESWVGSRWIPIAAKEYDGWIGSAHFADIATLKEEYRRFKGEGGSGTVAANLPVDLTAAAAHSRTATTPICAAGQRKRRRGSGGWRRSDSTTPWSPSPISPRSTWSRCAPCSPG